MTPLIGVKCPFPGGRWGARRLLVLGRMFAGPCLLLLLAASDPAPASARGSAEAALYGAREELDACAARIEQLKARDQRGAELNRLLRRAQELAAILEDAPPEPPLRAETPSGDELRERADAARDEADRLAAEIGAIDVRIEDARRGQGEPGAGVARAALGTPTIATPGARIRALLGERAALSERRARAQEEADQLDAEARAADRDR